MRLKLTDDPGSVFCLPDANDGDQPGEFVQIIDGPEEARDIVIDFNCL